MSALDDSPHIVTGDDVQFPLTLKLDEATFAIDSSATIKANFRSSKTDLLMLSTDVTILESASGSNWAASLVVLEMDEATTLLLTPDMAAKLEIQVNDSVNLPGKITFLHTIPIIRGRIP